MHKRHGISHIIIVVRVCTRWGHALLTLVGDCPHPNVLQPTFPKVRGAPLLPTSLTRRGTLKPFVQQRPVVGHKRLPLTMDRGSAITAISS